MVLKEYLGISPNYIFKKLDSDPLSFHCELKLFDKYYAEAVALTKKQAKHRTAMDMLVKMSQDRLEVKKLLKECNVHEQEDLIQETDNVSTESESVEVSKIQNVSIGPILQIGMPANRQFLYVRKIIPYYILCTY